MSLRSLKELEISGKPVLLRVNFDLELSESCEASGRIEIRKILPTLKYLVKNECKIIILSHRGNPQGWEKELSLQPLADELAKIWGRKLVTIREAAKNLPEYDIPHLYFFEGNLSEGGLELLHKMRNADAAVLENLGFYQGEKENDLEFAKKLAGLGSAYINEAFSGSHLEYASLVSLPQLLPAAAGLALEKETEILGRIASYPKRPVVLLLGGANLARKLPALENLVKLADTILLGGAWANLFLYIQGFGVGRSARGEKKDERLAKQIWRDHKEKIKLPLDVVVSSSASGLPDHLFPKEVKGTQMILDIGPETIRYYSSYIKKAATLIWSGPLGAVETPAFSHGSKALAWLLASRSKTQTTGIAGGGETLALVGNLGMLDYLDYTFASGEAMLKLLAGQTLPALAKLEK
jgi:phosphoglycerate kinase